MGLRNTQLTKVNNGFFALYEIESVGLGPQGSLRATPHIAGYSLCVCCHEIEAGRLDELGQEGPPASHVDYVSLFSGFTFENPP